MDSCDIKIDKDGIWYYCGAEMFRKEILAIFFENLKIDENGRYLIEFGNERYYLDVEDTAFVVQSASKRRKLNENNEQIDIVLTDETCERLDLNTLQVGDDNVLYCLVKNGKFSARFSRKSYYQLAEFIEEEEKEESFFICLNNEKYYIKKDAVVKNGGSNA